MTYEDFIEYIKKKVNEEHCSMIKLYLQGYTSDDPEILEWIRKCNIRYAGIENDMLMTDILVLKKNADEKFLNAQHIAVRQIFEGINEAGDELDFEQIKDVSIDLSLIHDRCSNNYEQVKDSLILRPLNYNKYSNELKECICRRVGDVALVLYQLLGESEHTLSSSKIHISEIEAWGMMGKTEEILQSALQNTAKLFPACVFDKREQKEVDLLTSDCSRENITILGHQILMTTFRTTNGAVSLFYPGVIEKLMEIMGGAFIAVFMNINDVMIFDLVDSLAGEYAKTAVDSSPLGEMLSGKCYHCDENGITAME